MSTLEVTALAVTAGWLTLASTACLLLVRQVGLLTIRLNEALARGGAFDTGLEVGDPVPAEAVRAAPELVGARIYALFLSSGCAPCRLLATDLEDNAEQPWTAEIVVILTGGGAGADGVAELLPRELAIVRDPGATSVTQAFAANTTPLAFQLERGYVTGKALLLRGMSDLVALIESRETSDAGIFVGPTDLQEVPGDRV